MRTTLTVLTTLLLLCPWDLYAARPVEWVAATVSYAKCTGLAGDANVSTSGAGADHVHTLACQVDAGSWRANGIVDACALMTIATGTTVPQLQFKMKACTVQGCGTGTVTPLVVQAAFSPNSSTTTNGWVCTKAVATAAPSAATNIDASFLTYPSSVAFPQDSNSIGPTTALNTAVNQFITITTQWLSNTGSGSSATLTSLIVRLTNFN